ncbi:uncharacterized protein LOC125194119 [Salvia hispanica]|uniref:uncharacterized protein LOC125194119 n=1 Tax=Salvia hispanica TaxID=49212 RepID=UPI00200952C5|nr:uncharacterized protein LOC125194119 [Salvia hispanica]
MASSRAGGGGEDASDSDSDSDNELDLAVEEAIDRLLRMHHPLFMHIMGALERRYEFFRIREDAASKSGHTPLQKCTAAIRQLAYGGPADMFDEYLHIGESSAVEFLLNFCAGVRSIFGDQYLRRPSSPEDCQRLINMHGSVHGFPGMLGA